MIAVLVDLGRPLKGVKNGVHLFKTRKDAKAWAIAVLAKNDIEIRPKSFNQDLEGFQHQLGGLDYFHFRPVRLHGSCEKSASSFG